MRNAQFSAQDIVRCCEKKLDISFRDGKELNGWVMLHGKKAVRITVPKGRKSLPQKTYKSMAHQLKLTIPEFDDLLECTLTGTEYATLLNARSAS